MSVSEILSAIVMVGHSLIGPENPRMLAQLLAAGLDQSPTVEAQIINGAPLSYNWAHADKAQGINARNRLAQGPVDAVVVTEAMPLTNHLRWSDTEGAVADFYELAAQTNPNVTLFVQEGWHSLLSGTGVDIPFDEGGRVPWRQRLDDDLPRWQRVVDTVGERTGGDIRLLPVGQALARLSDAIEAGTVPGLARIEDLFSDDIHPNDIGFYFISLVQYAALTGTSPENLPHVLSTEWGTPYAAPSEALALRLQDIAVKAANGSDQRSALPPDPIALPEDPPSVDFNTAPPVPAAPIRAASLDVRKQPIVMNLAPVRDWSPQAPFLDHFKTARGWIGHLPGQWGGVTEADLRQAGYLDADGWPLGVPPELGSVGTVLLTDLPDAAVSLTGRYVLLFDGDGIVEVAGRARNVRYGDGEVSFDFSPGKGAVEVRIQRSDREGSGDYVRNIAVVREADLQAYQQGAIFNPDWLDLIEGFSALRFMDWMDTNNATQVGWEDRPRPSDHTWTQSGVPAEILIALANRIGADPWFSLPHMADDTYVRKLAELVSAGLDPDLKAYVEYSNEVWNWQFQQAHWADAQARARWGGDGHWLQYYAGRATEVADIWTDVFTRDLAGGDLAQRLVRVLSSQTGWLGLEEQILTAPLWTAEEATRQAPYRSFDAYAVTGYFGAALGTPERAPMVRAWIADSEERARTAATSKGLRGRAAQDYVAAHRYDIAVAQAAAELRDGLNGGDPEGTLGDLVTRVLPYHADVASRHDLDLIMYEGGTHVVGQGPLVEDEALTAFFTHLNYTQEMAELYQLLLNAWPDLGGTLFGVYSDVATPGRWGSWGHKRFLRDETPRWDVLEAAR
ncbi:hypothetical protein [Tritonibacter horizontis]|uniref:Uncharacterized protein n=1 Tax=Tritonibacter horizontis TaxID=1768241 RepID=A0A132BW43_9RHOB|nr:hypothetical protein [Tritonibacter horizontis]KUP92426.1 hypothetical protein TRIHO_27300 [Tritonibacter horizontis]